MEFVSRNMRIRPSGSFSYNVEENTPLDGYRPSYSYGRIGEIKNNFPVHLYAEDSVMAFMNPETNNIAMPSPEFVYWFHHVLWHEVDHVEQNVDGRSQNEYGSNVAATRKLGLFDFFPIQGSYQPPNGLY
jgi:hypothetical protein